MRGVWNQTERASQVCTWLLRREEGSCGGLLISFPSLLYQNPSFLPGFLGLGQNPSHLSHRLTSSPSQGPGRLQLSGARSSLHSPQGPFSLLLVGKL